MGTLDRNNITAVSALRFFFFLDRRRFEFIIWIQTWKNIWMFNASEFCKFWVLSSRDAGILGFLEFSNSEILGEVCKFWRHFGILRFLEFWSFETLKLGFCTFRRHFEILSFLKFWSFENLKFWNIEILQILNIVIPRYQNVGIFTTLKFYNSEIFGHLISDKFRNSGILQVLNRNISRHFAIFRISEIMESRYFEILQNSEILRS